MSHAKVGNVNASLLRTFEIVEDVEVFLFLLVRRLRLHVAQVIGLDVFLTDVAVMLFVAASVNAFQTLTHPRSAIGALDYHVAYTASAAGMNFRWFQ